MLKHIITAAAVATVALAACTAAPTIDDAATVTPDTTTAVPQKAVNPDPPKVSVSKQNALRSAEDYLSFTAFSKQGLIDQLSSEYGAGFPKKDAEWAVAQLKVSWKDQAVKSAKDYLEFSAFSRQGLIDQLSSEYGGQFTYSQAVHAANKVGL